MVMNEDRIEVIQAFPCEHQPCRPAQESRVRTIRRECIVARLDVSLPPWYLVPTVHTFKLGIMAEMPARGDCPRGAATWQRGRTMDSSRFDALTKALAFRSRRGVLRLLATSLLASSGLGLRATRAAADCSEGGSSCNGNAECCSQRCVNGECLLDPGQQCETATQCGTNRCEVVSTIVNPAIAARLTSSRARCTMMASNPESAAKA